MGTGHKRKRGDAWQLVVYAGDGKYVYRTFHGGARAADVALAKLVADVNGRTIVPSEGRTVADLFDQWYAVRCRDWSPSTSADYRYRLDKWILPALGPLPLAKLSPVHLDGFYGMLRDGGLAASTVARYHNIVGAALEQGVRWDWIGSNPARRTNRPTVPPVSIRPPTPAQVAALLDGAAPDFRVFLALDAAMGARRGQLVALRWSDLDGGVLTVERTVVKSAGGQVIRPLSRTKGRARRVVLDNETLNLLGEHHEQMVVRSGGRLAADAFMFSDDPHGRAPWKLDSVSQRFRRLRARVGLDHVRLHDLRHYVATQLLAAGVSHRTVADRLGHGMPSTTLNMYGHPVDEQDRVAADLLAAILNQAKRTS